MKQWLVVGMNDNTVLGGIRATEGQGFAADKVIGIGINGVDAVNELAKSQATGFYGSLLPSPDVHGYKSIESLYKWVKDGVEPNKFVEVTDVVLITRDNFKKNWRKRTVSPVGVAVLYAATRYWNGENVMAMSPLTSSFATFQSTFPVLRR